MPDNHINALIKADNKASSEGMKEFSNLAPEECCPHSSAESTYIGEGDTEHTCRACGYYWLTHDQNFDI
jgi:hypothetical protein